MTVPGPFPTPEPHEIHVWWIDLARILAAAHVVLSPEERERASRLRRPADAVRWMSARAALRQILAGYVGASPATVTFGPVVEVTAGRAAADHCRRVPDVQPLAPDGPHPNPSPIAMGEGLVAAEIGARLATPPPVSRRAGRGGFSAKPALLTEPRLRFSLAHAGERAVLAVAWEREVGIDLEPIEVNLDLRPLLAFACSPAEMARIEALPPERRVEAFLTHWTVKETYLKAIGLGMFREPRAVEVEFLGNGRAHVRDAVEGDVAARWDVRLLDAGPGWVAALAVAGGGWDTRTFGWPLALDAPS